MHSEGQELKATELRMSKSGETVSSLDHYNLVRSLLRAYSWATALGDSFLTKAGFAVLLLHNELGKWQNG